MAVSLFVVVLFSFVISNVISSPLPQRTCSSEVTLDGQQVSLFNVLKLHQCNLSDSLISLYYNNDVPVSAKSWLTLCTGLETIVMHGGKNKLLVGNICSVSNKTGKDYCQMYTDDKKHQEIDTLLTDAITMKFPPSYIAALNTLSRLSDDYTCRGVCGGIRSEMCTALVQLGEVFAKGTDNNNNENSNVRKPIDTTNSASSDYNIPQQKETPSFKTANILPHQQQQRNEEIITTKQVHPFINHDSDSNPVILNDHKRMANTKDIDVIGESPEDTSSVSDDKMKHFEESQTTYNRQPRQPSSSDQQTGQQMVIDSQTGKPMVIDPQTGRPIVRDTQTGRPIAIDSQTGKPIRDSQTGNNRQPTFSNLPRNFGHSNNDISHSSVNNQGDNSRPYDRQPSDFNRNQPLSHGRDPDDSNQEQSTNEQFIRSGATNSHENQAHSQSTLNEIKQSLSKARRPFNSEHNIGSIDHQLNRPYKESLDDSKPVFDSQSNEFQRPHETLGDKSSDSKPTETQDSQSNEFQRPHETLSDKSSDSKPTETQDSQSNEFHRPHETLGDKSSDSKPTETQDSQSNEFQRPHETLGDKSSDSKPTETQDSQSNEFQRPDETVGDKSSDSKPTEIQDSQSNEFQRPHETLGDKSSDSKPPETQDSQSNEFQRPHETLGDKSSDSKPTENQDSQSNEFQRPHETLGDKSSDSKPTETQDSQSKDSLNGNVPIANGNVPIANGNGDPLLTGDKSEPHDDSLDTQLELGDQKSAADKEEEEENGKLTESIDGNKEDKIGGGPDLDKPFVNEDDNEIDNANTKKDDNIDENPVKVENAKLSSSQPPSVKEKPTTNPTTRLDAEDVSTYRGYGTWHFMSIFIFIAVLVIVGYFLIQYRRKIQGGIIAYSEKGRRRNQYRPLSQQ